MNKKPQKKRSLPSKNKSISNLDPTFFHGLIGDSTMISNEISKHPYKLHSWVYACAHNIANNLARLNHKLTEQDATGETIDEIYRHEVITLLNRPNPYMTKTQFWESVVLNLMLPTTHSPGGQVFLVPESLKKGVKVDFSKGDIPRELWPMNDEVMEPIVNSVTKMLDGWKYRIGGKTYMEFSNNEIIRIYLLNPYSHLHGMSPYSAAKIAIDQDNKASEFNTRAFETDGAVAGVLSSDQALNQKQRNEMARAWIETYGGSKNPFKIAVLGLGLKYQQFARSQVDMQFIKQKEFSRDQIFATYGLNELAFGRLQSIPFSNVQEGRRILWYDTYLPIQDIIWESMNAQWINYIDSGKYYGGSDLSNVQALREDMVSKINAAATMVRDTFVPPAEAFRILEIPVDVEKYPHLENVYVSPTLVNVNAAAPGLPEVEEPVVEPTEEEPGEKPKEGEEEEPIEEEGEAKKLSFSGIRVMKEENKRSMVWWDFVKEVLDPGEKAIKGQFEKFFFGQRNRIMDLIDDWVKRNREQTLDYRALIVDQEEFFPDLGQEDLQLLEMYSPLAKEQMLRQANKLKKQYSQLVDWNVSTQGIERFINARKKILHTINTDTFNKAHQIVGEIIHDGIDQHLTVQELAKQLKEGIWEVAQHRVNNSITIARTETGTISSSTRFDAFKESGVEYHEWLTARDGDVRTEPFNHAAEDGIVRKIGNPFPNTGLIYPLAPGGEAGNVINCRCTTVIADGPETA